jgi:predicted amidohydrolase
MSNAQENVVNIGVCTFEVNEEDKEQRRFYTKLFALCERLLSGCDCDIVLLPEQALPREEEMQALNGPIAQQFAAWAREHNLYLIAPLAEKRNGAVRNTQVAFSPSGDILFSYSKVHLAPGEEDGGVPGDSFGVFDLPWFRAGIQICFDHKFPESIRAMAVQGAQVIFFPSFGDLRDDARDQTRCKDNHVYLIGAGVIDHGCGYPAESFQRGMAIAPDGNVMHQSPAHEGIATVSLPLDPKSGKLVLPPPPHNYLARRRPEAYSPIGSPLRNGDLETLC